MFPDEAALRASIAAASSREREKAQNY
jgi:hypothetical protein